MKKLEEQINKNFELEKKFQDIIKKLKILKNIIIENENLIKNHF